MIARGWRIYAGRELALVLEVAIKTLLPHANEVAAPVHPAGTVCLFDAETNAGVKLR